MADLSSALAQVGVGSTANSLGQAIDQFTAQNLAPTAISSAAKAISDAATASLPSILRFPTVSDAINYQPAPGHEWVSVHYADDLIPHAPKFKFLFKVTFEGFGSTAFSNFVHRCDKPRVIFNHQEVNYYNFRTRVLTNVQFQPLNMSLLDETGNTVNNFFVNYLAKTSGQGGGNYGIDAGFGAASSTIPYERAYSRIKRVFIDQIFANGTYLNRFELVNPRIEAMDFDELNMEDSSSGSMLNLTLHYDALIARTLDPQSAAGELNNFGQTDILKGGGTSGLPNAGSLSSLEGGIQQVVSAGGSGIASAVSTIAKGGAFLEDIAKQSIGALPKSLQDLPGSISQVSSTITNQAGEIVASTKNFVSSGTDILSRNVSDTLASMQKGFNFVKPDIFS